MTLQDAIDMVKREADEYEYDAGEVVQGGFHHDFTTATATILNAVVKGGLK